MQDWKFFIFLFFNGEGKHIPGNKASNEGFWVRFEGFKEAEHVAK